MTDPEYTVHAGGHDLPAESLEQVIKTVVIEERYNLSTTIRRHIWCSLCEHYTPVVYDNGTFEALNNCTSDD